MKKIIVLGASGMLGHKVFEVFSNKPEFQVIGTVTSKNSFSDCLPPRFDQNIVENVYADQIDTVKSIITQEKPDVVINCIGIIKQNAASHDIYNSIVLNALFPHQVADICDHLGAKLITIATDCVFDGQKGESYFDDELPTCHDVYGMTKYLGEVKDSNTLTLRTSIIGHELNSHLSLLDWFLSQQTETAKGYTNAIFSGFTTVEFATLLAEKIIPNQDLRGLYHISVNPISKHDLLKIVADVYQKKISIVPDSTLSINRSLNSDKLRAKIGYQPPDWNQLIKNMHQDFLTSDFYSSKRKIYEQLNHF